MTKTIIKAIQNQSTRKVAFLSATPLPNKLAIKIEYYDIETGEVFATFLTATTH